MILPFRRLHIEVTATPEIVIERIRGEVVPEPPLGMRFRPIGKGPAFLGEIDGRTFRIRQVIRGRNSFAPLIWGRIEPTHGGSHVGITMFMHPVVLVFMLIWLGFCAWNFWKNPRELALLGMFVFGVGLSVGVFYWEAAKAERLLFGLVNGSAARA